MTSSVGIGRTCLAGISQEFAVAAAFMRFCPWCRRHLVPLSKRVDKETIRKELQANKGVKPAEEQLLPALTEPDESKAPLK